MKTEHAEAESDDTTESLNTNGGSIWGWPGALGGMAALFLIVILAYALGSRLAILLAEASGLDGVFFIPAGVTLAFLLRLPRGSWWVVLAGAGLTELVMDLASGWSVSQALGFAAANVVEPLVGATIVMLAVGRLDLARRRHVLWFTLGAVLTGPAIGALIGAAADRLFGADDFLPTFLQWWLGDALGVVVSGSAILVWGSSRDRRSVFSPWGACLILGSALLTVAILTTSDFPLVFSVLIGVVIAGALFGSRAVAMTSLGISLAIALTFTAGPGELIFGLTQATALLLLKLQVGVFTLAGLVVAAESHERELAIRLASTSAIMAEVHAQERKREHDLAVRIQRGLLPDRPLRHEDVVVAARYEAASDLLEVGGDWYDTIQLRDGRIGIVVGDIVGHGIEAMTAMGRLRTAVTALAQLLDDPALLLSELDKFIGSPYGTDYATAFYAVLDPIDGMVHYASAGHPPALMLSPDGELSWLDQAASPPLYGGYQAERGAVFTQMGPGSTLILYSDGLIERRGEALSHGLTRLGREATALLGRSPREICDELVARLGVGSTRADDVVVVALRLSPPAPPPYKGVFPARPEELSQIRSSVRSWMDLGTLPQRVENDLMIVLGEATANVVRHAYRDGDEGSIVIEMTVDSERVNVQVRDSGRWQNPPQGRAEYPATGTTVMRSLSDRFEIEKGSDGTIVSFSLPIRERVR